VTHLLKKAVKMMIGLHAQYSLEIRGGHLLTCVLYAPDKKQSRKEGKEVWIIKLLFSK
jgi:hypothetical protein